MTFEIVLGKLREGAKLRRKHWSPSTYLRMITADEIARTRANGRDFNEKRPIVMSTNGKTRAWMPTQTEILADDWILA